MDKNRLRQCALVGGLCLALLGARDVPSKQLRDGYVDIMPPETAQMYKDLLPEVSDFTLPVILKSDRTMWYDEHSLVPGYQDSMGDPEGMRPNTIDKGMINLAVPGGWERLFAKKGRFHFPFGTGGADNATNMVKINFWYPPMENGRVLPVVYWRLNWSRWSWMFPVGTVLGEVLLVEYPDENLAVFEIRTRTRRIDGWDNDIFRPFRTAQELANRVKYLRPNWKTHSDLRKVVERLESSNTLTPHTLETKFYPGTFEKAKGALDVLPSGIDKDLAEELLTTTRFRSVEGFEWKRSGNLVTFAPSAKTSYSIVPNGYEGGMLEVNEESCDRCHDSAGRSIRDFHDDLILYGEIWGEDETFSWHPFQIDMFVDENGKHKNFNNDNRRASKDFAAAGLVEKYNENIHPDDIYKRLPREWKYRPVR